MIKLFTLTYLAAGLAIGAAIHPIAGLTMLAAPVAVGRLG
jgi:hypothetical protein